MDALRTMKISAEEENVDGSGMSTDEENRDEKPERKDCLPSWRCPKERPSERSRVDLNLRESKEDLFLIE